VILKTGTYVYEAKSNKLNPVVKGDLRSLAGTQAFVTNAPVTLVFVADLAKMGAMSNEEKKRFANIDVGCISQNAYLFCASEGLVIGARASVDQKALGKKLNLRPDQMIVLAQSVGCPKPLGERDGKVIFLYSRLFATEEEQESFSAICTERVNRQS
jgi:nitroreductase